MSSPTQRSLKHLRDLGYPLVAVTERWNSFAKIRQDLFGIIDVLAVGEDTVGVQTTSAGNMSARIAKMNASEALPVLKKAGWTIIVHGWKKGSNGRWQLRQVVL